MENQQNPTQTDLLLELQRTIGLELNAHCPAKVVVYDPARQVATVEVGFLTVVKVTDPTRMPPRVRSVKGDVATLDAIILTDIPVFIGGTPDAYVSFPIAPGTTGELHVHDRALGQWLLAGEAVDPVLAFTHALADSVFHPGLRAKPGTIVPPTDELATVVEGPAVKVGREALLAAARATDPLTASPELTAWAADVEAKLAAAGFAVSTTWLAAGLAEPGALGTIASGSQKVTVE